MTASRPRRTPLRTRAPAWLWLAAAAFVLYFLLLVFSDATRPDTNGLFVRFDGQGAVVSGVAPGSIAQAAGLAPGDRVASYASRPVPTRLDWLAVDANLPGGRPAMLAIRRGERTFEVVLPRSGYYYARLPPRPHAVALAICRAGQLFTLLLACFVAFKRPADPLARLGAWLLASGSVLSIVLPFGFAEHWRLLPAPVSWILWLPFVSSAAGGVLFFVFCCRLAQPVFPSAAAVAAWCTPAVLALAWHVHFGFGTIVRAAMEPVGADRSLAIMAVNGAYLAVGVAVLARRQRVAEHPGDRRRLRILLAGSGVTGAAGLLVALQFWARPTPQLTDSLFGSPITLVGVPLMLALPVSIAYTVLRHRLFDVSLIVREGVRYALARRLLLSIAPLIVLALTADIVLHGHEPLFDLVRARGWQYAVAAAVLVGVLVSRERWLTALDQRFFHQRYHAELLLRDFAAELREGREPIAALTAVVQCVDRALAPRGVAALTWHTGDPSYRVLASIPDPVTLSAPDPAGRLVALARVLQRGLDLSPDADTWIADHLPEPEARAVLDSKLELLVPVIVEDSHHVLLVLGARKSEEPYSGDDVALLEAIGANLALVLERWSSTPPEDQVWLSECPACGACYDTAIARCPTDRALLVATDLPPILNARYRITRRIGAGGMGTVYQADDTALERAVAVKVLADHLAASQHAVKRFRHEAHAAAAFEHPNVVTIHDFGVTGAQRAYLVMERLEGDTLRARLAVGPLSPSHVLRIVADVCEVLTSAHARGLVHRDLKPENVFLARVGRAETTKVLDFGIAKTLASDDAAPGSATSQGVIVGSLPYMAPEQLQGGPVQAAWDLWALAIMAHEMLMGCRPGAGIVTPTPSLTGFFGAALAADPAARPQTPPAFRAALAEALSGETATT